MRFVVPLLWAMGLGGVVTWAGCGPEITTSTSSTGDTTSTDNGSSGNPSSSGSSSSSGTPIPCNGGPDCNSGLPSPGSPCTMPGECCSEWMCDHMGGNYATKVVCGDGGTWEWQ